MPPGSVEAAAALEHAQGVTKILRENVVQGRKVEGKGEGKGDGDGDGERYKLRMHEHTQRMDNDVAGQLKGTRRSFKSIKDAQF